MSRAGLLAFILCGALAATAGAAEECPAQDGLLAVEPGTLPAVERRVAERGELVILVFGSASAAGAGTTGKAHAFPALLAKELRAALPQVSPRVLVKAKRGRTARMMVEAIPVEIWPEKPDLVVWEIGGADAAYSTDIDDFGEALEDGIGAIRRRGADVMLIDPQYAPHLAALGHGEDYQEYVGWAAEAADAPLLRRYDLMRYWQEEGLIELTTSEREAQLQAGDLIHRCLARLLAAEIAEAAKPAPGD
jgi:ABC-type amino acid transport substrate-binding protein